MARGDEGSGKTPSSPLPVDAASVKDGVAPSAERSGRCNGYRPFLSREAREERTMKKFLIWPIGAASFKLYNTRAYKQAYMKEKALRVSSRRRRRAS